MSTLDPLHLKKDMPVDTIVPGKHHTWASMSSLSWDGTLALPYIYLFHSIYSILPTEDSRSERG